MKIEFIPHNGGRCEKELCQDCCEHEFDADEGYTCSNCGKEGFEDLCARAEYYSDMREDR